MNIFMNEYIIQNQFPVEPITSTGFIQSSPFMISSLV